MRLLVAATAAIVGICSIAQAQYPYWSAAGPGSYHHASTVEEGAARGMADVIRSAGAANLMNSEAAINVQEANKRYIENRAQWTNTYFQMREVNKKYRYGDRKPPTQEQLIRFSQEKLPERPSADEIDPLTGAIEWPRILQMDQFAQSRKRLEELAKIRAEKGFLGPDEYLEVKDLTERMKNDLRGLTGRISGNDSIAARKFLDGLAYEAGFQAS